MFLKERQFPCEEKKKILVTVIFFPKRFIFFKCFSLVGPLTLPKQHILDSSKLKEFADDNFKFDENDRKLFKRVEYTVGKEEIARYEQFLFVPQCFQRTCTVDT